jgi:hypothetical protein
MVVLIVEIEPGTERQQVVRSMMTRARRLVRISRRAAASGLAIASTEHAALRRFCRDFGA